MALNKPYLDVPGTTIFDAEQSRKGYGLNQFKHKTPLHGRLVFSECQDGIMKVVFFNAVEA